MNSKLAVLTRISQVEGLLPEWHELFAHSGTHNPFAHPLWLSTWSRHFTPVESMYLVTARNGAGKLIGVAPFYRSHTRLAPGFAVTRLRLLGTGPHAFLTELSQILTVTDLRRRILRDIIEFVVARHDDWDWIDLTLTPDQGWFEPQWLPQNGRTRQAVSIHTRARPCVVLPLPSTWHDLQRSLKRNVRESIRRGINRLSREGHTWDVQIADTLPDLEAGLAVLLTLHQRRALMYGKPRHPDYFADAQELAFLREVARVLMRSGDLALYLLRVNGLPVAGRLILRANQACFFSASGFDPIWWNYNLGTILVSCCLESEIARGATLANLSLWPDRAKLRWSEALEVHNDFRVIGQSGRSHLAHRMYQLWRVARSTQ